LAAVPALVALCLPGCRTHTEEHAHHEHGQIVATTPKVQDVVITQQYVCQIHSQRHIEVRALESGYLEKIAVKEGQAVKQGDAMFKILPTLYQAKLDADVAEAQLAEIEFKNTEQLFAQRVAGRPVVAQPEVAMAQAKLAKAQAQVKLAQAELNFTEVKAPFDGMVDRLEEQQGSLVDEGDVLTTLSDNSLMWVYFNVPEARYLEYKAAENRRQGSLSQLTLPNAQIELVLADGSKFDQTAGDTVTVEGQFNNETGNIAFRADFPNPDRLLRHGQTGNVLIHRTLNDAVVIPQRAVFEILDKQYVFVIDEKGIVRQRGIVIQNELEDIFVIESGLDVKDNIVLEGVRQVRDGEKVHYEFMKPGDALSHQKFHAE
jgi:membrane fusion protein (multidrug efflux system)